MIAVRKPLRYLFERAEALFDRVFGPRWNPFSCLGALGWFYFWIVCATGLYLFIFFDTGIHEAYRSVEYMTREQWYLAGVMRSLHRYASDAMVVMVVVHMLREFAYDRYRGARWYSWLTGIPALWFLFAAGITGYWMVWDRLAQYVAIATTEWLDVLPLFGEPIARNFASPAQLSDRFFTLMIFMHIAVPLILLFIMWFHLQRVNYAKLNPARGLAVGTALMLLVLALAVPAVSQGPADLAQVPTPVKLDWFYLWVFPLIEKTSPGAAWAILVGGSFALMAFPWLPPEKKLPVAAVNLDNCNGCRRCATDCPFAAIRMGPRSDGRPFAEEPVVDPELCVGCGICAGACPTAMPFRRIGDLLAGIEIPHLTIAGLRAKVEAAARGFRGGPRVLVFGCDHGADVAKLAAPGVAAISLPCTGMLPPPFVDFVLSRHLADGVVLTGCRSAHCRARLGVRWTEERIEGRRDPALRARVPRERLALVWASPSDMGALRAGISAFAARLESLAGPPAAAPERTGERRAAEAAGERA
ncbi:MAG: cytochrome b N-terminal domain-containing protein [Rhodospirillales bacterium]|nr:cytochrome b N-terminal domain-containing protein [Rhodospirillales bacterium]